MTDTPRFEIWPGCIEWDGARDKHGYGKLVRKLDGKTYYLAHRYFYAKRNGPIPDGLVLDHLCRNTSCINPDHLEPVTQRVNVLRGTGMGARYGVRAACKHGHPYGDNPPLRRDGGRRCVTCEREIELRRQPRRRAKV